MLEFEALSCSTHGESFNDDAVEQVELDIFRGLDWGFLAPAVNRTGRIGTGATTF